MTMRTERNEFDLSYEGTPPWDIGRAQKEFVLLEERGEVKGSILDMGCGTGENSLYFASRGHEVLGIDFSEIAIRKAQKKAQGRHLEHLSFRIADALNLSQNLAGSSFDNVIDSGVFHVFTDDQRNKYVDNLQFVLKPSGKYFMLCFSELEPADWGGPRRITKKEIETAFLRGWQINYFRDARIETNFHQDGGKAWFISVSRLGESARS
ncbi:MAG TPA: class I SAM-dependent methyltransferase [Nitrososphaerales archaeon]|nr:class I SAM-dependent methyltransferase [Nitrososphaerales archaeon]